VPFLNRIQMWADLRPAETAIAVWGRGFSWAELRGAAEELVPSTPETYILSEANSAEFAALYCAGIAGGRQIAVLDPAWTPQAREEVTRRLPSPSRAAGTALEDGDPDSAFLIGFTAGTTSTPKAFTRSRRSWQASFDASIEFFGLRPDDKTFAPGPLSASLNLYALSECLYAGTEFHTLRSFDVGDAHAVIIHDGITRLVLVPTMLRLLSERGLMASVDASSIRTPPSSSTTAPRNSASCPVVALPRGSRSMPPAPPLAGPSPVWKYRYSTTTGGPCRTALPGTSASRVPWCVRATCGAMTGRPSVAWTATSPLEIRDTFKTAIYTYSAGART
jgi:AMP-binding enzyme